MVSVDGRARELAGLVRKVRWGGKRAVGLNWLDHRLVLSLVGMCPMMLTLDSSVEASYDAHRPARRQSSDATRASSSPIWRPSSAGSGPA